MEATTKALSQQVIEKHLPSPPCMTFKMGVMVTGIAIAALGMLVAAFANVAYLAASFFVIEVALVVGAVTVREHEKMRSLPALIQDLRETNANLEGQIDNLEAQIEGLKSINADLSVTAEKVDSVYKQYVAACARADEARQQLEQLATEEKLTQTRLLEATRRLEEVERKLSSSEERIRAATEALETDARARLQDLAQQEAKAREQLFRLKDLDPNHP